MTRHLFAFLALLSGLAAIGQPVHAHLAEAAACDAGVHASADASIAADHTTVREASQNASRRDLCRPAPQPAKLPAALRLPVLMGVERAHE